MMHSFEMAPKFRKNLCTPALLCMYTFVNKHIYWHFINPLVVELSSQCTLRKTHHYFACYWSMTTAIQLSQH